MQVMNFLLVLVIAVLVASCLGFLYATGLRLVTGDADQEGPVNGGKKAAGYVCFGLCILIVLFALYLIIPIFH